MKHLNFSAPVLMLLAALTSSPSFACQFPDLGGIGAGSVFILKDPIELAVGYPYTNLQMATKSGILDPYLKAVAPSVMRQILPAGLALVVTHSFCDYYNRHSASKMIVNREFDLVSPGGVKFRLNISNFAHSTKPAEFNYPFRQLDLFTVQAKQPVVVN